jgi:hypothetical protein
LIHQRCLRHDGREAAARCPACRRYFCRECVTEHEGKVICAECLAKLLQPARTADSRSIRWVIYAIGGITIAWIFFYYLGAFLSRTPASFHGGA